MTTSVNHDTDYLATKVETAVVRVCSVLYERGATSSVLNAMNKPYEQSCSRQQESRARSGENGFGAFIDHYQTDPTKEGLPKIKRRVTRNPRKIVERDGPSYLGFNVSTRREPRIARLPALRLLNALRVVDPLDISCSLIHLAKKKEVRQHAYIIQLSTV